MRRLDLPQLLTIALVSLMVSTGCAPEADPVAETATQDNVNDANNTNDATIGLNSRVGWTSTPIDAGFNLSLLRVEFSSTPENGTTGGLVVRRYVGGGGVGTDPSDPPPPAPPSVIDPFDPWSSLGALSGSYRLSIVEVDARCDDEVGQLFQIHPGFETGTHGIRLVHRGDGVGFELSEGVVFGTYDPAAGRLNDVERVGSEGTTRYLDGFAVGDPAEPNTAIEGESRWTWQGKRGGACDGTSRWTAERNWGPPTSTERDLQIVLRWPASSDADLDLTVVPPSTWARASVSAPSDFVTVRSNCYALHATGTAVLAAPWADGFVSPLDATPLPYHEEVVRCRFAAWGSWNFYVTNWSEVEDVDYSVEVFWGPRVNTTTQGERSFGALPGSLAPLDRDQIPFSLTRPVSPSDSAGLVMTTLGLGPPPRPRGPLTRTHLEFHKAAYEGLGFEAFADALGLVANGRGAAGVSP